MKVCRSFAKLILIILGIGMGFTSQAQDGTFSQYFTNPMFLNPAFVGSAEGMRVSATHRIQWPYIPGKFSTSGLAIGYQPNELLDGVGAMAKRTVEGEGGLTTTQLSGLFSRRWVIPRTMDIQAGMQVGAINQRINWNKLVFSDQLDPLLGNVRNSQARKPANVSNTVFDVSAGVITKFDFAFNGKRALNQAGFAVYHINRPSRSFTTNENPYPTRWVAHYGVILPFKGFQINKTFSLYPNVRFEKQQNFSQLDLSTIAFEDPLFFGVSYRNTKSYFNFNNTAQMIMTGGIRTETKSLGQVMIGYSYDFSMTGMKQTNRGSHEISLMFFIEKQNPEGSNRNPDFGCSKFYNKGLSPIF